MKQAVFIIIGLLLCLSLSAQEGKAGIANKYLAARNFEAALTEYLALLEKDPDNLKYNYRTGVCYLNTNMDKTKALPYLEKVVESGKHDNNALYLLGRALHFSHQFDEAMKLFVQYKEAGGGSAATLAEADKQIEYCENAKELMKFPLDVTFENLGSAVNTPYPDYFPFVPIDESFLVFNSKRDDGSNELENGSFSANVYLSKVEEGKYGKARPLGEHINTMDGTEEVIGLSASGDHMLLYFDNYGNYGDIFITIKQGDTFDKPVVLEKNINSPVHEIAASISKDGSTIYFASDRKDGFGGTDLYVSYKLPKGGWGPPQNMGTDINTEFDEDFPNISPDGQTLYFSSKGHTSMGGYDIFRADKNQDKKGFSNVRNLRYPVNTTMDDMNLRISETGRHGYIAAIRPEGQGDYDIYRVTFNNIEPRYTVIKGIISSEDTSKTIKSMFITVSDIDTEDIYGNYVPNPYTNRYIIILPPGDFNLYMEAPGHKTYSEDIFMLDKSSYRAEIKKDVVLQPR